MGEPPQQKPSPAVWERLLQSGYFFFDYTAKNATVSRFMAALGYTPDDFVSGDLFHLVHPADLATYRRLWNRVLSGQEDEFFGEYRIKTKKGGYRWVQTTATVLTRDTEGRVAQVFGFDRDIGLRKQADLLLHSRFLDLERRYTMSESLRIAGSLVTASLDIESTVPVILEQAQTLFPFTGARVWAHREGKLELLGHDQDGGSPVSPPTEALVLKVVDEKTPLIVDNLAQRLRDEQGFGGSWLGIPLLFQGQARGAMEFWHEESGSFRSEHVWPAMAFADNVAVGLFNARQFRESQEAGETDALTGLPSRHRLERLGPKVFQEAVDQGRDLAMFMVDMDNFKVINDTFGHAQGDVVLKHFAAVCQTVLRKGDLMCRYGGDEFVALLPNTGSEAALAVGRRLVDQFRGLELPFTGPGVSLSLGVATLVGAQATDLKGLLEAADAALYRAKARGRDCVSV